MKTGQRVTRFGMIELADGDGLPIGVVVALQAVLAEPPFMFILMTGRTGLGDSEIRLIQIFDFDCGAISGGNLVS